MGLAELLDELDVDQISPCDVAERENVYLPSQEEIAAACRSIQSEWSDSERERRARGQAGRDRSPRLSARMAKLLLDRRDMDERAA